MGKSYADLKTHPAWKNLVAQMYIVRDSRLAALVSGEGDQVSAREAVKAIDAILLTVDRMVAEGELSEQELRYMAAERNGTNG